LCCVTLLLPNWNKIMSSQPSPTPVLKSSASSEKNVNTDSNASSEVPSVVAADAGGAVPTDKVGVMHIVNMMQGGTLASLGLDCCCCCGGGRAEPLVLNLKRVANKRSPMVRGKGLYEWCKDQQFRLPFKATRENVAALTQQMINYNVILKAELVNKEEKNNFTPIRIKGANEFKAQDYYIWHYQGDQTKRNILMATIVGIVFFFCLMPAWPRFMKVGVWYLSCTLLLLMISFSTIRMVLWLVVWIASGWNLTIFPYIFIDGIPIADAFVFWSTEKKYNSFGSWYHDEDKTMRYYRVGALIATIGIAYWVYTQPTEFDDYISATKGFTDDLYSGNLLSDMSQSSKENIDKPKYQSLADILFEEAENAAQADKAAAAVAGEEASPGRGGVPSLEELESMDTEGGERSGDENEDDEAARILREIQEEEEAEA
jgi:hypothetical protein